MRVIFFLPPTRPWVPRCSVSSYLSAVKPDPSPSTPTSFSFSFHLAAALAATSAALSAASSCPLPLWSLAALLSLLTHTTPLPLVDTLDPSPSFFAGFFLGLAPNARYLGCWEELPPGPASPNLLHSLPSWPTAPREELSPPSPAGSSASELLLLPPEALKLILPDIQPPSIIVFLLWPDLFFYFYTNDYWQLSNRQSR